MKYVKSHKFKKQYSDDKGVTWIDVTPAEYAPSGDPIGYYDTLEECIHAAITPKFRLRLVDSSTIEAECDATSSVTQSEISAQYSGTVQNATIYDCVTNIDNGAFYNCNVLYSVNIPDSIETIGNYAFWNCSGMTKFETSLNTKTIGDYALDHTNSIEGIYMPDSVTHIGKHAFSDTGTRTIVIGSGITSIDDYAFYNCHDVDYILIQATTPPSLGTGVFDGRLNYPIYVPCESVDTYKSASVWSNYADRIQCIPSSYKYTLTLKNSSVVNTPCFRNRYHNDYFEVSCYEKSLVSAGIHNCITVVPNLLFYGFSGLTNVDIAYDVKLIGAGAFGYTNLTNITIPDTVEIIKREAFTNTPWWNAYKSDTTHHYGNLVYINNVAYKAINTTINSCSFKSGTVSIGGVAFQYCKNIRSINIPNTVIYIGDYSFYHCSGLTSINLPDSVIEIDEGAFNHCTRLSSATLGDSVEIIGNGAFGYCRSLSSVTIPASVTEIDNCAFWHCSSLRSITIKATTPPLLGVSVFEDTRNSPIYVPSASVEKYKATARWSEYADRIQAIT